MKATAVLFFTPRTLVLAITCAIVALGLTTSVGRSAVAGKPVNIVVSDWRFTPQRIVLDAGDITTFRLTSEVGVHGIRSDDLGIPQTTITGIPVAVTFTPRRPGTYGLACSVFCGRGHAGMVLVVLVR